MSWGAAVGTLGTLLVASCAFDPQGGGGVVEVADCEDGAIDLCLTFEDEVADKSNRNNLVTTDAPPVFAPGVFGQALDLDGSFFVVVDNYRRGTTSETVELWVTTNAAQGTAPVLTSDVEIRIEVQGDRVVASSGGQSSIQSGRLVDGFHHVAVRIEQSSFELFVDGSFEGTNEFFDVSPAPTMGLGLNDNGDAQDVGVIDQVRVWARALSDSEIETIAASAGPPD